MCVFCKIVQQEIPAHIIYQDDATLVILDIAPATKGHCLVIPKNHYANLLECPANLSQHLIAVTNQVAKQVIEKLEAAGCNILSNINEVAGQTVEHAHIHIIPRYHNDGVAFRIPRHQEDLSALAKLLASDKNN